MNTRILAISKADVFLDVVKPFLSRNGIEIAKVCHRTAYGLEFYESFNPDLVILDVNWNEDSYSMSATKLVSILTERHPSVKIILMTTMYDRDLSSRIDCQKIAGYFYRTMDNVIEEMVLSIRRVLKGLSYFPQQDGSTC